MSIYENVKRIVLRGSRMPAAFLDGFLITVWIVTGFIAFNGVVMPLGRDGSLLDPVALVLLAVIVQTVQTEVYHELIRPTRLRNLGAPVEVSYSRLRSLVICVCNYFFVVVLFGFLHWRCANMFLKTDEQLPFGGLGDAVFFSFTTSWSCGSLSIQPADLTSVAKCLLVFQIACSLIMFSIVVGLAVGSVQVVGEIPREPDRD
jgi:hypothetical protein